MNDHLLLKAIINEREKRYIELDDAISKELLALLVNTTPSVVDTLFKSTAHPNENPHRHSVCIVCSKCGSKTTQVCVIGKLKGYLTKLRRGIDLLCAECQILQDIEEKKAITLKHNLHFRPRTDKKEQESCSIYRKQKNAEEYIQKYLACGKILPNGDRLQKEWDVFFDPYHKWKMVSTINKQQLDVEKIVSYIKNMTYVDFLATPYWKTIAQHVKWKSDFTCTMCGAMSKLVAHHKTYEHHGEEHLFWETDLSCICEECHKKIHNK